MALFKKHRSDGRTNDMINNVRKGFIDRIKFDGPYETIVWKFPYDNLTTGTQLIVNESQEAIFYKEGQALDTFGPGTHTLTTGNLPLIQKLVNLPFGGKTPFTAEVWYINKTVKRDTKWGTKDPINIQDPNFKIIIPVRSYGEFGFMVSNSRNFMTQIVGTLHTADIDVITKHFNALIINKTKDTIGKYIIERKISVLDLPAKISELSELCEDLISGEFAKYGLSVTNFYIESINYPEDNPSVIRLQDALAKKAEMDIVGYTYQQERTYDTLETAAGNEGNAGNMMGAGMGLGMGVGVGGAFGNAMSKAGEQINTDKSQTINCPKCNTTNPENSKFCSNCGSRLVVEKHKCPGCGKEYLEGKKFCSECGMQLTASKCPNCGLENPPGTKFCSECGQKL